MPAVLLNSLRYTYARRHEALAGIDLTISEGTVFAVVGPNGAGKTTLVKIITGQLPGYKGVARVAGIDVHEEPTKVREVIGYVPEDGGFYQNLTVAEHLLMIGRLHGLSDQTTRKKSAAIIDGFSMKAREHAVIRSLSKGMKQRVHLISALLHDPDLLILDEPFSGLDVQGAAVLKVLVRSLADEGKTVFLCSHHLDFVERMADQVAIIDHGTIVERGTVEELRARSGGTDLDSAYQNVTKTKPPEEAATAILTAMKLI